jgi:PAS domain S-box-containing protein
MPTTSIRRRSKNHAGSEDAASSPVHVPTREQQREAARAFDARYRRFLETLHDMRFVVASNGSLADVNEAGVELFGFTDREEMMGVGSFDEFFQDPEVARILRRHVKEDGFVRELSAAMRKKDGSGFNASITAYLASEGESSISFEGLLRDMSQELRWQAERNELEERNRSLQESEEHCRRLNEHILHMLMVLAHDIRGPLVSIAATLKLLIRGTYGRMDESVQNTIRDLFTRSRRLLGVAEDYLGGAHSANGVIQSGYEMLDLREDIIDPVLDELLSEIEQRGITIDNRLGAIPGGLIPINVSKVWLKAVFRNLFMNALKYGDEGGRIAFGFEDHGVHYRLNVYNSGRSIPEEHRAELFTRFGRIRNGSKPSSEGIGLGLYLIREIIRRHGGDIWYEAKPDGSDFVFTLLKESTEPDGPGSVDPLECSQ